MAKGGRALFAWKNRGEKNEVHLPDGKRRASKVTMHGQARFGRFQEMLLEGGWGKPDVESSVALVEAQKNGEALQLEFAFIADALPIEAQLLFRLGQVAYELRQGGVALAGTEEILCPVEKGVPVYFATDLPANSELPPGMPEGEVIFGGGASVRMEALAISSGASLDAGIRPHWLCRDSRNSIVVVPLEGESTLALWARSPLTF